MIILEAIANRIHHAFYALAAVAIAAIVIFFWPQRPLPAAPAIAAPSASALAQEFQAGLEAEKLIAATAGNSHIAPQAQPAVTILSDATHGAFDAAAYQAFLSALGRTKTAPVVHVSLSNPAVAPAPSTPPEISPALAAWHHSDTYSAVTQALAQQHLDVHVTQDPVPPSRTQSLWLTDHTAGLAYALRRRGIFDLDLGIATGNGTTVTAGIGARIKGTQAGVYVGPAYNFQHHAAGMVGGLSVSF